MLRNFYDISEIGIYICAKSMRLCVTWRFYVQIPKHFEQRKTIWPTFFNTQKSDTLCFWIFLIGGGVCHFFTQKTMNFALNLYLTRNYALSVPLLIQKAWHFALHFIFKNFALCVTFYIQNLSYPILWYLTINVRTIRSIVSINKFELFIENWSYFYYKWMIFVTYQKIRS